jgi:glycosyltransferase involved in cell wall biosynthesis
MRQRPHDLGHGVSVVFPRWPYRFHFTARQQREEFRRQLEAPVQVSWFELRCRLLRVPLVRSLFLPRADVVLATSWPTAHDVARLHPSRGRKAHLVMHHERDTGPEARIDAVYRLPLYRITLSQRVRDDLRKQFDCDVPEVVPCGIDRETFFRDGIPQKDTVLMLYHPEHRKGADDGLAALARLGGRRPGVRVRVCGTVPPRRIPDAFEFSFHPSDAELRRLYSGSAALLYPSRYEGFGLPPLEAMACGCPVVATRVGAVPEYAVDRDNALLVEPGDVEGMAEGLHEVLADATLRERLSEGGLRTVEGFSLRRAALLLESALLRAIA